MVMQYKTKAITHTVYLGIKIMRIIEPQQLKHLSKPRRQFRLRWLLMVLAILLLISLGQYYRPLPQINAQTLPYALPTSTKINLPWPNYGQAALRTPEFGLLAYNGAQKAVPIASVAKVMTALTILQQKPLNLNEAGPTLTLDSEDVSLYQQYLAQDGSVVAIADGEQLTEYQALQALLLPSANNMAVSLARWTFGSEDAYVIAANQQAAKLGLNTTHISDASGFSPQTTSTASDLVALGEAALRNPVIAQIVSQSDATIPVAGTIHNVNWLLGQDGITGIKTGNTTEAGGCFLFSAPLGLPDGHQTTMIGAIVGAPDLQTAMRDSQSLLKAARQGFEQLHVVQAGQVFAHYTVPWGLRIDAQAAESLSVVVWKGTKPNIKLTLNPASVGAQPHQVVGSIQMTVNKQVTSSSLILSAPIGAPPLSWRLWRRI